MAFFFVLIATATAPIAIGGDTHCMLYALAVALAVAVAVYFVKLQIFFTRGYNE